VPRIIYKSAPELDEYVWWTTVSDGPVSGVLTRDQMHAYLLKETSMTADEVEERLQRTDEAGSSWESRTPMWDTEHYVDGEADLIPHRSICEYVRDLGRCAR
jgi:hypothetical protein